MLAFQNLHQIVFNLSQVTTAVTSGSARWSPTPAKAKPEIDVFCNESFLRSLNIFRQSENFKLFDSLPSVRFGPRYKDIQWIYLKDLNVKFKATDGVNKNDLHVTVDKNNFSYKSSELKSFIERQEQLLGRIESESQRRTRLWSSYVSEQTFDKNKESTPCCSTKPVQCYRASPVVRSLLGNSNVLKCSSEDPFRIQRRGFKTRRAIQAEEEGSSNQGLFARTGKKADALEDLTLENPEVMNKSNKYLELMGDQGLSAEDKVRLKISFAEGYMVASKELRKDKSAVAKVILAVKNILYILVLTVALTILAVGGRKILSPFNLATHSEVDPEEVAVTFADVKGVEEVKEELQEIVEFLRNPAKFSSMGGKLPRGVLLVGPPGTGKTLLARAVAGEASVPFFHASGSEFDEIFVGEGARRVRNLFKSAKASAPAIIFIDEIDCVGSKRRSTMLHPYANQTINQLLSEMDGFAKNEGIIVLGATNRKSDLDPALLRPGRFDVEVLVPLPDTNGRREILELYIGKIMSKGIDIDKIAKATSGCSGADLEAMINHAALRAATEGASYVTMEHIENAKDKIMIGPERKSMMKSDEANLMTAYHEGGHTIVAYFSEGVGVVDKVTIVPRGESLGHTAVVPEDDQRYLTKAMCLARMDIVLGGRAAEELVYGPNKITANASDDLDKATSLAMSMIKNFGMSEKIGLRTLKSSDGELVAVNQFGQNVSDQVDLEVKRLIQESYERAKSILKKHAKEHKLLAEALVKYKTLSPEDVKAILGDNSLDKSSNSSAS